jgi:hypothetical protein
MRDKPYAKIHAASVDRPIWERAASLRNSPSMGAALDQTEELLAKLESELAPKQAAVDARLQREKAQLDALIAEQRELTIRKDNAVTLYAELSPQRDALVQQRDELRNTGSRGSRLRASLWSALAIGLTVVAVIPLSELQRHNNMFPTLLASIAAVTASSGVTALWMRWRKR